MGWTTCFNATEWKLVKGRMVVDRRKECDKNLTWEEKDAEGKVTAIVRPLKSAMVGSVYYGAIEKRWLGGEREPMVFAAVFLTCGSGPDGTVWGYKDMDETMEPYYYDCPPSILNLLTPTEDEGANRWREGCRRRTEEKKSKGRLEIAGVTMNYKGAWRVTSDNFRQMKPYDWIVYRRWQDKESALYSFLTNYGTEEQKAEFEAKTGRKVEPPYEFKKLTA